MSLNTGSYILVLHDANFKVEDVNFMDNIRVTFEIIEVVSDFISKATDKIDACVDWTRLAIAIDNKQIRKLIVEARNRGVKLRCITEITSNNILSCKQLLEIVDELRHLNGIEFNEDLGFCVPTECPEGQELNEETGICVLEEQPAETEEPQTEP